MNIENDGASQWQLPDGTYRSRAGLNYSYLFFYERKFFDDKYIEVKQNWMRDNWYLSIVYAVIYIVAIFAGQYYMKSRERFDLRKALIAWNFVLAGFSLFGAVRIWPEFVHTLVYKGVEHSVCNNEYTHGVFGCWSWLFVLSKVPELVDTLFIVLRKQQLIFLHWYHHATVLIYCWFSTMELSASGRWFVIMNFTVHAAMYTYYGFRALRFRIPKWVNIAITSGQIAQMVFGIYINFVAYFKKRNGEECQISDQNITMSFLMYFSYFVLFFDFFYKAYISTPSKKSPSSAKTNGHANHALSNGKSHHHASESNGVVVDDNNNNKKVN